MAFFEYQQLQIIMELKTGDRIPYFSLPDRTGKHIKIDDILSEKSLVLYFYPKDETAGCTRQACFFRDHYQDFMDAGAEVVGISSDSNESHDNFARHHNLPFILLSDAGGELRKQFGVPNDLFGLLPGRVTFIIDRQGIIKYIFNSQVQIKKHITESLRILNEINK